MFNYALCQARPSPMAGMFHGATAAIIWGGFIPLFLMIHRVVFLKKVAPRRDCASLRVVWGAVAGILTGFIVTTLIAEVFDIRSLVTMGWVTRDLKSNSIEFWEDCFFKMRYGWAYTITGSRWGFRWR